MSFESILGQAPAIRLLVGALTSRRVASGYLFFGPEGVGKHLTALAFARAGLCREGAETGDACGRCPACVRSAAGSHPGLILVGREEGKTLVSIGQIQELGAELSLRPIEGESKFAIIDGIQATSIEGMNALLKTLEEPAPGTTLVLVTSALEAIPETIRSRCQGVRFRPLSREIVLSALADEDLAEEERELVCVLAAGSIGRARRVLEFSLLESLADGYDFEGMFGGDPLKRAERWASAANVPSRAERRERGDAVLRLLLGAIRAELQSSAGTPGSAPATLARWAARVSQGIERLRLGLDVEGVLRAISLSLEPPATSGSRGP